MRHSEPIVTRVTALDIRLDPGPLAFAERRAGEIAARWRRSVAANPALYDGPILLFSRVAAGGGQLTANAHVARFSAMLALLAEGDPDGRAANLFGSAAIVAADGALLLGRMGPRTASPGEVKLVGGTPDLSDVVDGERVDILGSIRRELGEETGLDAAAAAIEPELRVVVDGPLVAVIAVLRFADPAARLVERVEAFLAADAEPELAGVVALRPGERLDAVATSRYTLAFLADFVGGPQQG
jgi:8-oxo-dGTP pyrophosphatase MutT (NUDIX family)